MVKKMKMSKSASNWMSILLAATVIGLTIVLIAYVYRKKTEGFDDGSKAMYELVYVYSDTCPHCIAFTPIFDQYAATQVMNSKIKISKVERRDAKDYMKYISGFPTVLLFDADGNLKDKLVGRTTFTELQSFVDQNTK